MKEINCLVVGDDSVGKTCLLTVYKTGEFPELVPTICDEYTSKISLSDSSIVIKLYDSVNEHVQLRPFIYSDINVFIVCFSLVLKESMESVEKTFIPEIEKLCPNVPYILVGTKCDLRDELLQNGWKNKLTPISKEEGQKLKEKIHANEYIECSPLKKINIQEVFESAAKYFVLHEKQENSCCLIK